MSAPFPFGITVTVERSGKPNKYGDKPPPVEHTISGVTVYPRTSSEATDNRDTVVIGLTMLAPHGSDVKATDVIRFPDGTKYQVDGEPGSWGPSPFTGWKPGMQVALERVTG